MSRKVLAWSFALALSLLAAISIARFIGHQRHEISLRKRIDQIVQVGTQTVIPCDSIVSRKPLVLLALGQSNAANHGSLPTHKQEPVVAFAKGKCISTTDPLPGGTGKGGSIWQPLSHLLAYQLNRPVVFSVLAVDASSIDDWTSEGSPIKQRLSSHVISMHHANLSPTFVLWQQGEADTLLGTSTTDYETGLARLAAILHELKISAPIFLARSTICKTPPNSSLRIAMDSMEKKDHRFRGGPDTDSLSSHNFRDGCHLTTEGLDSAAKMWASVILKEESAHRPAP